MIIEISKDPWSDKIMPNCEAFLTRFCSRDIDAKKLFYEWLFKSLIGRVLVNPGHPKKQTNFKF